MPKGSVKIGIFSRNRPKHEYENLPVKHRRKLDKIQSVLSPNLLNGKYKLGKGSSDFEIITSGHCYASTEAAYHLFAKEAGYVPYSAKNKDGSTHWWLVNEENGQILDPTYPQLCGDGSIYDRGTHRFFLPQTPSKRAQEIIRRMSTLD